MLWSFPERIWKIKMELKLSEEKKHGKDKVVPMRFFKLAAKLAEDFTCLSLRARRNINNEKML